MEPGNDVDLFVRDQLARTTALALRNDPSARRGDPEGFHQLRVASRRLRTLLDVSRDVLEPSWRRTLDDDAQRLARRFGARRDADVLVVTLRDRRVRDPTLDGGLAAHADLVRRRAALEAARALDGARYRRTIRALADAVVRPPLVTRGSLDPLVRRVRMRLERATFVPESTPMTAEARHRLRIAVKHARYAAEALSTVSDPELATMATRLAQAQDALGVDHDLVVALAAAEEWYRSPAAVVGPDPGEALTAWRGALEAARPRSEDGWRVPLFEVRVLLDDMA